MSPAWMFSFHLQSDKVDGINDGLRTLRTPRTLRTLRTFITMKVVVEDGQVLDKYRSLSKDFNGKRHAPSNKSGRDRITIKFCPVRISPKWFYLVFSFAVGLIIILSCHVEETKTLPSCPVTIPQIPLHPVTSDSREIMTLQRHLIFCCGGYDIYDHRGDTPRINWGWDPIRGGYRETVQLPFNYSHRSCGDWNGSICTPKLTTTWRWIKGSIRTINGHGYSSLCCFVWLISETKLLKSFTHHVRIKNGDTWYCRGAEGCRIEQRRGRTIWRRGCSTNQRWWFLPIRPSRRE